jgi:CRP-like cAMP-binding protein
MRCRTATAIAAEDCELVRIPRDKALELMYRRPTVGLAITHVRADRLTRNAYNTRAAMTLAQLPGIY